MRYWLTSAVILLFIPGHRGIAQLGSDNHTITVRVLQITGLQVNVGSVSMSITGAGLQAGQDTMTVTNQTSILTWGTNLNNMKTTASTNLASPRFSLKVVATNNTAGTPAAERVLSTTSGDFLLNMGRSSGTCRIRYTGVARAQQGTGVDNHVITFTVQSQ